MSEAIAIVGAACRYPDARSPVELWENVLSRRRAFRRIPATRLRLEDYLGGGGAAAGDGGHPAACADPDTFEVCEAAVLEGYEFDRVRFRVAGATFRTTDLVHWLALEVADDALIDAGFPGGRGLPHDATGVLLGNSLTGEFSRSSLMRSRWPYVRRVLAAALAAEGWDEERAASFLAQFETSYKAPFPTPTEESLAGGLSNTIAGRICNHFDLHGGGFTVDGACASSLLAVANACSALAAGDLDLALAGGVDLSLDPFELVGFARTGALATPAAGGMRVYDASPSGFLPGEGCGMVVLMRERDAAAHGRRIHALVRGWGVSSDGNGGLSRPEARGQRLALSRAYRRAGFGIGSVGYFEGHGTGTPIGDPTELAALAAELAAAEREDVPPDASRGDGASGSAPIPIGTVKANIGHTKAAAGVAGLLKAMMAVRDQVLPPTTGCESPHALLAAPGAPLKPLPQGEIWPAGRPLRAGVSAMGFGGINTHLVIEGQATSRRRALSQRERSLLSSAQDVEIFALAAPDREALAADVERLLEIAPQLSRAEVGDLAATLHARSTLPDAAGGMEEDGRGARAAVLAATQRELTERLALLLDWLRQGAVRRAAPRQGVFLGEMGTASPPPRVGFLFPGQGAPANLLPDQARGAMAARFEELAPLYALAGLPELALRAAESGKGDGGDALDTSIAQPAILAHSLAGLWLLERLGIRGSVAVGHSLGELTALCWAGACREEEAIRLAAARGRAMAEAAEPGSMAGLAAGPDEVAGWLDGTGAVIAAYNGPRRTVISGATPAVEAVVERARLQGVAAHLLRVSHAFHSPRVAAAVPRLEEELERVRWEPLARPVVSTVTGGALAAGTDCRRLLLAQVTSPVRFSDALAAAGERAELWIEVGPGHSLSELAGGALAGPILSLDAGGGSLRGLLSAAAAAFAAGLPVDLSVLFDGRFNRPFDLSRPLRFLANPCESAPLAPPRPAPSARAPELGSPALPALTVAGRRGGRPAAALTGAPELGDSAGEPPDAAQPPALAARPEELAGPGRNGGSGGPSPLELVRQLVAARAELPASAVHDGSRLLSDLHLNSISVGQLAIEAYRRLGLPPPASPTDYAQATVGEMARALAATLEVAPARPAGDAGAAEAGDGGVAPAGAGPWVRPFTIEWVERGLGPLPALAAAAAGASETPRPVWCLIAPAGHPLAAELAKLLDTAAEAPASGGEPRSWAASERPTAGAPGPGGSAPATGSGIVLCLPPAPAEEDLPLFLQAAETVAAAPAPVRFLVVQSSGGGGGGGFARTLHLELPAVATCVLDLPSLAQPATDADGPAAAAEAAGPAALPALPLPCPTLQQAASWVLAEARALAAGGPHPGAASFRAAAYDAAGCRRVPVLRPLPEPPTGAAADPASLLAANRGRLGPADVLLVSGGGKGIGAECALDLAKTSGARLAVLGRSAPEEDAELAANLGRMAAAGVRVHYVRADVADAAQVRAAVAEVEAACGPVTALLHAAGTNVPRLISALDEAGFRRTLAPKVAGARNLLAAIAPDNLRLVIGFGSIIGRIGLRGEAEYALANEWLGDLIRRYGRLHPGCRCLVLDWSVWAGVGMGERLGTLEGLTRSGVVPIPVDVGVATLRELLARPLPDGPLIVTGRFGEPPTLEVERPELPLLRFLERPRAYYPGIELVADTTISADTDPHLADHVFRGEPLFAAVLGLEAMAQVAMTLVGATRPPSFEQVELRRPVAVAAGRSTTLRIAALARNPRQVEVVLREAGTGFAADHFRALCRFDLPAPEASAQDTGARLPSLPWDLSSPAASAALAPGPEPPLGGPRLPATSGASPGLASAPQPRLALDPPRDLYGSLLFHRGRFRRIQAYRRLRATECLAEIAPDGAVPWFGSYLPSDLVLGDPGARDAAVHAIQACIPHAALLPTGAERILIHPLAVDQPWLLTARERSRSGDTFVYDLEIRATDGRVCERWEGLRLRAVSGNEAPDAWAAPLLAPYVERKLQEILPGARLRVALAAAASPANGSRPESRAVIDELLGLPGGTPGGRRRRPDGKPEATGGMEVSVAHAGGLVLAVAGAGKVGCDLEPVAARSPELWRDLIGADRFALAGLIARERGEAPDAAATRVWAAAESLHKAGVPLLAPLTLESAGEDGWLLLRCGGWTAATFVSRIRELGGACALAVVSES